MPHFLLFFYLVCDFLSFVCFLVPLFPLLYLLFICWDPSRYFNVFFSDFLLLRFEYSLSSLLNYQQLWVFPSKIQFHSLWFPAHPALSPALFICFLVKKLSFSINLRSPWVFPPYFPLYFWETRSFPRNMHNSLPTI